MRRSVSIASILVMASYQSAAQTVGLVCNIEPHATSASSPEATPQDASAKVAIICPARNAVQPEYPSYASRNHIYGDVVVELSIGEAGQLEGVKVLKSAHSSLSNAVIAAVQQWKFVARGEKYSATQAFSFAKPQ